MPTKLTKDTDLLLGFIEHISKELKQLFFEGVYARGRFWHAAVLGFKGDMVWFKKIGRLDRCYSNQTADACMCHECLAGTRREPFEDLREQPSWSHSLFAERPWGLQGPSFAAVPYDREHPEKIMQRDTFHNTKIGVFRDFVGSTVLLLCELGFWNDTAGSNAREELLKRAHCSFKMYCLAVHRPAALHSFSKDNFNAPSKAKFPWISCKGSDTTLLMEWLAVQTRAFLNDILDPSHAEVLETMNRAARAGDDWTKALYKHGIFLTRRCALALYREERRFLLNYNKLSHICLHTLKFPGYALKPKIHMLAHTAWEQHQWLVQGLEWIPSPIIFSCEANEDMVGRVSRLARRTHQRTTSHVTLEMFLIKSKALYRRLHFAVLVAALLALRSELADLPPQLGGFVTFPFQEILEFFLVTWQCFYVVVSAHLPDGSAEALAFKVLLEEFRAKRKGCLPWDELLHVRQSIFQAYRALCIPSSMSFDTALLVKRLSRVLRSTWGGPESWPPPPSTEDWATWLRELCHFEAIFRTLNPLFRNTSILDTVLLPAGGFP
eukprot:s1566_g1.t1